MQLVIKHKVEYKATEWPEFNNQLKQTVEGQRDEAIHSLSGRGQYRVCEQYQYLQQACIKMTSEQRYAVVKQFDGTSLRRSMSTSYEDTASNESGNAMSKSNMSVTLEHCGITFPGLVYCFKATTQLHILGYICMAFLLAVEEREEFPKDRGAKPNLVLRLLFVARPATCSGRVYDVKYNRAPLSASCLSQSISQTSSVSDIGVRSSCLLQSPLQDNAGPSRLQSPLQNNAGPSRLQQSPLPESHLTAVSYSNLHHILLHGSVGPKTRLLISIHLILDRLNQINHSLQILSF